MHFKLHSKFKPAGDQPKAIAELAQGIEKGYAHQTLLGVTGSGKTFAMANVIEKLQRPTLVIVHNKTLAAQLCQEFREFFPKNAVEYFVSYYDYYQPEAYMATTDTYIEKEAMINEEIDRLRHAATQAVLTRRDVIIVASVSCIYGLGSPEMYRKGAIALEVGGPLTRGDLLRNLIDLQFERTNADVGRGQVRVRGDVFEIMPVSEEALYRVDLSGQQVREVLVLDPVTRKVREKKDHAMIFPRRHYVTFAPERERAIKSIRQELKERLEYFRKNEKLLEIERLDRRTRFDLEMIKNAGYCHGIENYSRHFDGRSPGEPPFTLLDYFAQTPSAISPLSRGRKSGGDFLTMIDESHVTVPQLGGMYGGDSSRKRALIEYGFRLPSAADNRPLKFNEFEDRIGQIIFTSATPGPYEREKSRQTAEMIVRPTGLVDPEVIVRPIAGKISQVDDLLKRIKERISKNERVLVTTLTKKMAEDLTDYVNVTLSMTKGDKKRGIMVRQVFDSAQTDIAHHDKKPIAVYLHSDVDTLDRIKVLAEFRRGKFDVLIGVNLLREGLDLPEVSLVAILDADKEGFLRSETALIQTIGRAARNVRGQVILYADEITDSMKSAMGETERRRVIQIAYNKKHGITPKTIQKRVRDFAAEFGLDGATEKTKEKMVKSVLALEMAGEKGRPVAEVIAEKEKQMKAAAKALEFELAAIFRDEIRILKKSLSGHPTGHPVE